MVITFSCAMFTKSYSEHAQSVTLGWNSDLTDAFWKSEYTDTALKKFSFWFEQISRNNDIIAMRVASMVDCPGLRPAELSAMRRGSSESSSSMRWKCTIQ